MKNEENIFNFQDNCISTGSDNLSVLLREYWQLAVNLLTRSPKFLDVTKSKFLELKLSENDKKVG